VKRQCSAAQQDFGGQQDLESGAKSTIMRDENEVAMSNPDVVIEKSE
jgi:hypothetical protein